MRMNVIEPNALHLVDEHVHSVSQVYPSLAAGVNVVSNAAAWTLGAAATVVPASTISEPFDVHWLNIANATADDTYELVLYADGVEIGRVRFTVTLTAGGRVVLPPIFFQSPIVAANAAITAKVAKAGAGAQTITMSIHYHTYS